MDTIETREPVGAEGATSSQDTSQTDAQPLEAEENVSDIQSEESGDVSPKYAGKYNSPEELEKAYLEAQSAIGKASQKANLVNQLERTTGMTAQQIEQYILQQSQQMEEQQRVEQEQQIQENPGLVAFQELQRLKGQLAMKEEENTLDSFLRSEEGKPYQGFRDKLLQVALYVPAYKNKDYSSIATDLFGQVRAQGQNDAYKKIDQKIQSQVTGVNQGAQPRKITPEDMKGMSTEELRAILPHRD